MKRAFFLLLCAFFLASSAFAVTLSSLTNTNASHELPAGANAFVVPNYQGLLAVTNMWCGDIAYQQDNGQEWIYQCPTGPQTPGYGTGTWAPFAISASYLATSTYTPTPTLSPTPTYTGTWTPNTTFTPTPSYTPTPTLTFTTTITPGAFGNVGNQNFDIGGGLVTNLYPTWTPISGAATQAVANVVLTGKSLGSGTDVTPTPAISGGYLTIYHPSHGYSSGDYVVLAGITASPTPQYGLDALVPIATVVSTNLYNVAVAGSGNVAGTAIEMFWFKGTRVLNPSKIQNITRASTGVYTALYLNSQTDAYYGLYGVGSDDTHSLVFSPAAAAPQTTQANIQFNSTSGTNYDPTGYMGLYWTGLN